eukprot:4470524-Prymnesium_polylepis.1
MANSLAWLQPRKILLLSVLRAGARHCATPQHAEAKNTPGTAAGQVAGRAAERCHRGPPPPVQGQAALSESRTQRGG